MMNARQPTDAGADRGAWSTKETGARETRTRHTRITRYWIACTLALAVLPLASSASAAPGPAEQIWWTRVGMTNDYRLFTADGDWRYGFPKYECGPSRPTMVGFSDQPQLSDSYYWWEMSGFMCATSNVINVDYYVGISAWFGTGDRRRDTSTGDWAYGYDKAECGSNEVLTGMAQQQEGINEFRCSAATTKIGEVLHATNCESVDVRVNGGQEPPYYPGSYRGFDWDYGADKMNCGTNRYIKGFAVDVKPGHQTKVMKLLCCGPQLYPGGVACNADEQCLFGMCNSGRCQDPVIR